MATKKFNSVSEITINDIRVHNIDTIDKDATFVYVVTKRYYENNTIVGRDYIEGVYANEGDALQYMLNRINCKAQKDELKEIQIHECEQVDFCYTPWKDEFFRQVWRVDRMPVHHTL